MSDRFGVEYAISSNCSYKRHVIRESWKDFAIKNVEIHEKEKLGLAVGKALAKNLIINFEHTELEKEV